MEPLLEVRDLAVEFVTQDGIVHAVNGISYALREGEALGIVGESGCGKSVSALTLMRLIPTPPGRIVRGEIWFRGRDLLKLRDEEMRRIRGHEIAMIFQDPMTSLNPVLTVGRQISEALELHKGLDRKAARQRTIELLEMVGIPSARTRVDDYPHQFSGGMRQRVMIAMAISCEPRLLIADEPTTALDVTIQAQILDLIQRLRRELGMAVILITHDLGVVAGLCDRIAVMYAGYIVEEAPAEDLFADPRHPYTLGLLRSIPRIDEPRRERLIPIEGMPPDLINLPVGCPFAPRCAYAVDRSELEMPELRAVAPGHKVACWVDVREAVADGRRA
ncbi:MAG TPA: ABC transporter ATP-binding protein [Chloroflexota bacterium]|jgi:oligopeptide transport system ATP-binding protein|nr:ABC transporter ATP-binding protein [Chloroflexota bacterium]